MLFSIPAQDCHGPGKCQAAKWRSRSSVLLMQCLVLLLSVELQTVALEAANLAARAGCSGRSQFRGTGARDLKIIRLAFSDDVQRKYHLANGEPGPGYVNEGERPAPPIADLLHGSSR